MKSTFLDNTWIIDQQDITCVSTSTVSNQINLDIWQSVQANRELIIAFIVQHIYYIFKYWVQ